MLFRAKNWIKVNQQWYRAGETFEADPEIVGNLSGFADVIENGEQSSPLPDKDNRQDKEDIDDQLLVAPPADAAPSSGGQEKSTKRSAGRPKKKTN